MDKISEFAREQAEVIRAYSDAPITHNSSVMFGVDHEDLFKSLDFASFDTYASQENSQAFLFNCDLWRNIKKDGRFGLWRRALPTALRLKAMRRLIKTAI